MPYESLDDLPDNIKKLSKAQQEKWRKTWNNTFRNCQDDNTGGGAGSSEKCEKIAFRIANGTIKKEVEIVENKEKPIEETTEKDLVMERPSGPVPVVVVDEPKDYKPFSGAESFEELDEWRSARDQQSAVDQTTYETRALMENVMDSDDDLATKPGKIKKIASGFQQRAADILSGMAKAIEPEAEKQVTKTEDGVEFKASDYAVVPDAEKPATWKLRLAEKRSGNFTVVQVARAITAMQPSGFRGQRVQFSGDQKKQAVSRIGATINKTGGTDDQKENLRRRLNAVKELKDNALFMVLKDTDGTLRWLGIPSNKWRDRDNPPQIIEESAHKEFINYLDETKEYPVLLSWHTPGTRLGVADFADYSNGFLIMGGTIDKDRYAEAEKLAEKCLKEDIGMSHGFVYTYSDQKQEVIGKYRMWEVSHLPLAKAANVWTSIDILNEEVEQMLNPEKRQYLVDLHGEDMISAFESKVVDLEGDLASLGIESKELGFASESDTESVVQETVKALVESDGFKAMIAAISTLTDSVKELKETTIPSITQRLDDVDSANKENAEKTQKTTDQIIAEAFTPKNKGFQASEKGEELSDEDRKKEQESGITIPVVNEDMLAGFVGGPIQQS